MFYLGVLIVVMWWVMKVIIVILWCYYFLNFLWGEFGIGKFYYFGLILLIM